MIGAITGLLLCQLLGEVVVRTLSLPIPGPVAGMALMFAFLAVQGRGKPEDARMPENLGRAASFLLSHLSLLFVPAAVGIVQYFSLLGQYGWAIAIAIIVSTLAAMLVTVGVFRAAVKIQNHIRRSFRPNKKDEMGSRS